MFFIFLYIYKLLCFYSDNGFLVLIWVFVCLLGCSVNDVIVYENGFDGQCVIIVDIKRIINVYCYK